ncbi:ABC transporter [Sinomonas atrocyanea]|uniref:ABC transporter n=2 Tax=Sinomonas atrocyanea TaxID=37927 RepID=UPI001470B130|nr:ABC transporter [Sinomonas atrocyanea]
MEDRLIDEGLGSAEVDGHDIGAEEMNIYITTANPQETFRRVQEILHDRPRGNDLRAAYRDLNGAEYIVLWPKGLDSFSVT